MKNSTKSGSLLLVMLLFVGLIGAGCGTTKTVGPQGKPYRSEINKQAKGNTARITLRNGERLELDQFRIDSDSASGLTEYKSTVSIATSQIERVKFVRRDKGALWGGISLFFASALSFYISQKATDTGDTYGDTMIGLPELIPTSAAVGALPGLLGAGGGALIGKNEIYKFETPPSFQKPQTPTEEEKRVITQKEPEPSSVEHTPVSPEGAEKSEAVSIVDTQIPETDTERPDDIAVVIGNTEYKNGDIPNVDYAVRDAEIMKKYLTRTLGFREENVIYVENASGAALTRIFGTGDSPKGQLYNWIKPQKSDVFVYYSGHGAPNPETGNAYLIASNTNPNYLSQNGYPLTQLYENLSKLPAKSVTVVLEACFSGVSGGGAVVQEASPVELSVENPVMAMDNGLAFTAGAVDQIASWYPEKKHGLFTYYFLKGLRGNADTNSDKAVTAKEMKSYLSDKVPYRARRMFNREQTPQVVGKNLNRVLVQYGDSAPAAEPKATLPITTTNVQESVKNALSLPDGAVKVESATNADGLQQGDVITTVNGTDLNSEDRLTEIVNEHDPGDTLELNIIREGKPRTVSVTLTASQ